MKAGIIRCRLAKVLKRSNVKPREYGGPEYQCKESEAAVDHLAGKCAFDIVDYAVGF